MPYPPAESGFAICPGGVRAAAIAAAPSAATESALGEVNRSASAPGMTA
jgi:hypothetical protein